MGRKRRSLAHTPRRSLTQPAPSRLAYPLHIARKKVPCIQFGYCVFKQDPYIVCNPHILRAARFSSDMHMSPTDVKSWNEAGAKRYTLRVWR